MQHNKIINKYSDLEIISSNSEKGGNFFNGFKSWTKKDIERKPVLCTNGVQSGKQL